VQQLPQRALQHHLHCRQGRHRHCLLLLLLLQLQLLRRQTAAGTVQS
jgi:hypothetical protein